MRPYDSAEDRDVTAAARGTYVVRPGETMRAGERDVSYQIDGSDAQDPEQPEQIRVEIEETRLEMTATVDAIQERLNPSVLMEQAKEHAQDVVREATDHAKDAVREATVGRAEQMVHNATDTASGVRLTIMDTIRANPLPAAIAGISLGWLFFKRSHRSDYRGPVAAHSGEHYWQGNANADIRRTAQSGEYYSQGNANADMRRTSHGGVGQVAGQMQDRAGEMAGQVQDRVGDMAERVQDRASGMAEQVADTASQVAEGAQFRAQRMQGRMGEILEESPLMAGALALTVGAAIGLVTPSTDQERELFGETRDNLMHRARGTAQEMGQKVQRVAEQVQDAAVKAADEQKLTA